ncbi:hypothetical protein I3843_12G015500 [Carya illinoinensis]|uniref:Uncharacterized protein n=1 Tax=Carya illinoinensis TaxID=32201 RepID=A0A8T1NMW5_CARIL|nr:hypothetical protein CIPAW_12G015400 [Carya illinoinensis]KAG7951587.1 hypothetical protein I3843_12G015500 [Carya illinoinensis]
MILAEDIFTREISNQNKLFAFREITGVVDDHHHEEDINANNGSDIRRNVRGLLQHDSPDDGQGGPNP